MKPQPATAFSQAAFAIVAPLSAPRQTMQAFRTLFTTMNMDDAIAAGFDHAEREFGEDGGFEVHFDGRGSLPTVTLNGIDGEVSITGLAAITEARKALEGAEAMARRMEGA